MNKEFQLIPDCSDRGMWWNMFKRWSIPHVLNQTVQSLIWTKFFLHNIQIPDGSENGIEPFRQSSRKCNTNYKTIVNVIIFN